MQPTLLHLIPCDDIRTNASNLLRVDVLGVLVNIRATGSPPFPLLRPQFCVLLLLTNAAGNGDLSLRITEVLTGMVVFRTRQRPVRFRGSPEDCLSFRFNIVNCSFPRPGLYWIECLFSGVVIGRQRLRLYT